MHEPTPDDVVALDFDSVRHQLTKLAKAKFPHWTDHSTPGFGNVLLDLYAYVADLLGFYIDAQGREARLATVTQRENAVALAQMLGYQPTGATAAQAELLFTLKKPRAVDVVIPIDFLVRTEDVTPPVVFRLLEAVRIAAGDTQVRANAEASTRHLQVVDTAGAKDLAITLVQTPYLDRSIIVNSATGEQWREVQSFLDSRATDHHFVVNTNQRDEATVRFGNNILGTAPTGRLDITYKTGGGKSANVEANRLIVASVPILDAEGRPTDVRVTNPQAASGGSERESIESIRHRATQNLRVARRTITREDFEINACKVPGVARALMLTANEDDRIAENTGRLLIVPEGGGTFTDELRQRVLYQVTEEYPCTLTFQVVVEQATYRRVDIAARLSHEIIERSTADLPQAPAKAELKSLADAQRALEKMFAISDANGHANTRINFGYYCHRREGNQGEVAWSDVVKALCDVPGVRKVDAVLLNGIFANVLLEPFDFPVLGTVSLGG